jgi:hypothetical protein
LDFAVGDSLFINLKKISVLGAASEKKNREKKQTKSETKYSRTVVEGNPPSPLVN